uniref:Uncharacterized protein n=1 Tax=Rhodosorus marinus TaxID=101924 RepID=A0A7S0BFC2_9RHOD|mmetsp:Transcript_12908/g.18558  ORF Transcript_12908/g.18558 Transcript_12908/m.18558 type:complete len:105 (+) Transcript_12908:290-604(+)
MVHGMSSDGLDQVKLRSMAQNIFPELLQIEEPLPGVFGKASPGHGRGISFHCGSYLRLDKIVGSGEARTWEPEFGWTRLISATLIHDEAFPDGFILTPQRRLST